MLVIEVQYISKAAGISGQGTMQNKTDNVEMGRCSAQEETCCVIFEYGKWLALFLGSQIKNMKLLETT